MAEMTKESSSLEEIKQMLLHDSYQKGTKGHPNDDEMGKNGWMMVN